MAIFKSYEIQIEYNNFIIQQRKNSKRGVIHLEAGEEIILDDHSSIYQIGSIASYVLKRGGDPIAAYNRAVQACQETHYLLDMGTAIKSNPQKEKPIYIEVSIGQIIYFEGFFFQIKAIPDGLFLDEYDIEANSGGSVEIVIRD